MTHLRTTALALVLAAAVSAPLGAADIIEQILVKVNGEIITKTDLEQRQIAARGTASLRSSVRVRLSVSESVAVLTFSTSGLNEGYLMKRVIL